MIITKAEKEVFDALEGEKEKDLFIEAFWNQRDPTPGTPANERKDEHYRRLAHANQYFGRGTPVPGWKTDRGRIFILLGEPQNTQRFVGRAQLYPTEVWFYQDLTEYGLPAGFNIVFFKRNGSGPYVIYSPLSDGPQALLSGYFGDLSDHYQALQQLRQVEPQLAEVSYSLIPGEDSGAAGRPSISSDILIQKVESSAEKMVRDSYARKFLDYKDRVDVEYSTRYLESRSLVRVFRDESGMFLIHYALEPERLSLDRFEDKVFASLRLNGVIKNKAGKVIHQFEKRISIELEKNQLPDIQFRPFSIRDVVSLIPGNYQMSVLLMNETSSEFTSMEHAVTIPEQEDHLWMTPPLLCYDIRGKQSQEDHLKPFSLDGEQLYFHSGEEFAKEDDLTVFFQAIHLSKELTEKGVVEIEIKKEGDLVHLSKESLSQRKSHVAYKDKIPLKKYSPGYYTLSVSIKLDDRTFIKKMTHFTVSHAEQIPRPWITSKTLPPAGDPFHSYWTAAQFFNSGNPQKALALFEDAFRQRPTSYEYAVGYAKALFALGNYARVEEILAPFLEDDQNILFDTLFMLARARHQMGKVKQAISDLEKMRLRFGANIEVLNLLGICYFLEKDYKNALDVWERSLEIKPDQLHILDNVKTVKEYR